MHRHRFSAAFIATAAAFVITVPFGTAARAADEGGTASGNPFGPASVWRTSLSAAPIDANSQAMVDYMVSTITDRYSGVAAFNAHQYNSHLYTVDATTPTTDFAFDDCQRKGYAPSALVGPGGQFKSVPVPADAVAATGTDAELSIYSSATDQLWEFWKARKRSDGTWSACWGGRLDHVSTSAGYFAGNYGATATSLPNAGGLVRLSEVQAGRIDHMMSLAIPKAASSGNYRWPAQRSDGTDSNPAALPEGSRLRLDPSIDLSTLRLSPAALTIAKAAQQYGFVVVDVSGAVSVLAEAVSPVGSAPDPWRQFLGTPDYSVMKNFPWSKLQVVADGWRGQAITAGTVAPASGSAVQASPSPASAVTTADSPTTGSPSVVQPSVGPPAPGPAAGAPVASPNAAAPLPAATKAPAPAQKVADGASGAQKAADRSKAAHEAARRKAARHEAALRKAAAAHRAAVRRAAAKRAASHRAAAHRAAVRKARDQAHS